MEVLAGAGVGLCGAICTDGHMHRGDEGGVDVLVR